MFDIVCAVAAELASAFVMAVWIGVLVYVIGSVVV